MSGGLGKEESSEVLSRLAKLLGDDVFFVPCEWGTKKPLPTTFKCVCCGRNRKAEEQREPQSEVCVRCVRAAGFTH